MVNVATKKKEKKQSFKVVGKIPINHDVFNQILVGIGRRKFGKVTTETKGDYDNGT